MYYNTEIPSKKTWVSWLSTFQIGEQRIIDPKDRYKIASSISFNYHHKKIAKFKIFTDKMSGDIFVKRLT